MSDAECFSDPIFEIVTFHDGREGEGWHGGPGWYYTYTDYPDEGSHGPFKTFDAAMEHAEEATYE